MINKYKKIIKNITFCIIFIAAIFMLSKHAYSSYNPSKENFLKANAKSLIRKKPKYEWQLME